MHSGRFMRESRITTNIAHLSAARLKKVEFLVPPKNEQDIIVGQVRARLGEAAVMESELDGLQQQAQGLRQALLHAAFTGALVPQDPDDEPASVLLDRIHAQRAASAKPTRRTRASRTSPAAPKTSGQSVPSGSQEALPL
jgi:type I restriction enzyme S subunit